MLQEDNYYPEKQIGMFYGAQKRQGNGKIKKCPHQTAC